MEADAIGAAVGEMEAGLAAVPAAAGGLADLAEAISAVAERAATGKRHRTKACRNNSHN